MRHVVRHVAFLSFVYFTDVVQVSDARLDALEADNYQEQQLHEDDQDDYDDGVCMFVTICVVSNEDCLEFKS